jgi:threo-3-hydroxy-L-aspartate ammonia-lyase
VTAPAAPAAIDADDVRAAARRLLGVAHRTPVMTSRTIDGRCGATVFFKCENLQRTGSFKFRGAFNAVASLSPDQRRQGVLAFSSGNHAQAVALAARLHDVDATIVMPEDAPAIKVAATRGYGATVVTYDRYRQDREAIGRELAAEHGMALIPPFDHPAVMAGQGTAAMELLEEVGGLDTLVVCVGGGGLIAGSATITADMAPACRVVGVEPEAGDDVRQSLSAGHIVRIDVPSTIADGAQTQQPGTLTFPIIQALVGHVVTVSDDALVRTTLLLAERMKLVVEPTGALGAAALLEGVLDVRAQRVGVILSGGNVDLSG